MPITPFQNEVLHLLASHRNPESHVGGGTAINRAKDSPRFSEHVDIFHDSADKLIAAAAADATSLREHGLEVQWEVQKPTFHRALISRGQDQLRLDWAFDSTFRFFPIQADPEFGYCLHAADVAVNKALALGSRVEGRDFRYYLST